MHIWIQLLLILTALILGIFISARPRKTIDLQIAIYRPFNWKIEPISMEKEVRNMRIMGGGVALLAMIALLLVIYRAYAG